MVNEHNFISLNEVLADVTQALNDKEERKLSHGFYVAQVHNAIDELGFSTVFLEGHADIQIPANNIVSMASNMYRLKKVHVFNGTPNNITSMENVYWKKGAIATGGKDGGFTANMYPGFLDIYFGNSLYSSPDTVYWFVYNKGNLVLSDACASFDYVRLVYDGIPSGSLDDAKFVPPEVRKAVVLWTIEKCAGFLKASEPGYRTIQLDAAAQLDEYGFNGAWQEAKRRIKYLGKKVMSDIMNYNNRPRA